MSRTLIIHGGRDFARRIFREERRGYWTAALPLVLEKHGLQGVEVAGPERLSDRRIWDEFDAVLVGRLPAGSWSPTLAERARRARGGAIVEGPLPAEVAAALGVSGAAADAEGTVHVVDGELASTAVEYGAVAGGAVGLGTARPFDRTAELDWTRLGVPIAPEQARAWRAAGWAAERWTLAPESETSVLAEWRAAASDESTPALVGSGGLVGCSFGLFAYLGQSHTVMPFESGEWRNWPRTLGLEVLLLALVDRLHERAGQPRARILPWPNDIAWALSIRHDVDRLLVPQEAERLLARHREVGTAATWYWRASQLASEADGAASAAALRTVAAEPGHEVAHHTERLWAGAEQEEELIEASLGSPVQGTAAHGDPNCFRFQGAPNILWAERRGHLYTEFIGHAHTHSHRAAVLREDGDIDTLDVVCLPHHESFDRSMTPGDTAAEAIVQRREAYERTGGLFQVLSHPDLSPDTLFELLDGFPTAGRIDWSARQAADWWRKTHRPDELTVRRTVGHAFEAVSRQGIAGPVLEIRLPDGSRRHFALTLAAGTPVELEAALTATEWQARIAPLFAEAVRAAGGTDSTVRTNSELVPQRARVVLSLLGELTGVRTVAGRNVLEVGSGFGALAAYLRLADGPASVTGFERRADLAEIARACAAEAGIEEGLVYESGDMRDLAAVPDGSVDVLLFDNALSYLTSRTAVREAAASMLRVLAPGGVALVYQAARPPLRNLARPWRWRRSNTRLWRPRTTTRLLRDAGFEELALGAYRGGAVTTGSRARLSRHFGVAARKPDGPKPS